MYISDDNIRLNASLDWPGGKPKPCPLVILIHGYTGHSEERHILALARTVNETGYAALRVEMYGHGKSDGDFYEQTLFKWMSNVMAVVDYARKALPCTEIYLCGHSQGGLTVMLAAALKRNVISGLIALSPAVMIPEQARRGEALRMKFAPDDIPETLTDWHGLKVNGNYARAAQMIHVEEAIAHYKGPVLLVHADTDEVVPYSCSVEAAQAFHDATLVTIPDDTHCYDNHLEMVLDAIRNWLPDVSGKQG